MSAAASTAGFLHMHNRVMRAAPHNHYDIEVPSERQAPKQSVSTTTLTAPAHRAANLHQEPTRGPKIQYRKVRRPVKP
jgi:hypothetical protein